jgi:hypothetical protein
MLGAHRHESGEARRERGQLVLQPARELRVLTLRERVERQAARPRSQCERFVPRPCARLAQRCAQIVERCPR